MSKLCEAFNRINSKFGANRIKLKGFGGAICFDIIGLGSFTMVVFGESIYPIRITENCEGLRTTLTVNAKWLTGIANGKVRDSEGNMVNPEDQVSN